MSNATPRSIYRLPVVMERTGYKRTSIYNLMADGQFPQSRKIGARAVGWDSREVEAWITSKLEGRA